jgi:hypothetical protein
MNILALDPAQITGWRSPSSSGIFICKEKSSESKGMRFIRFKNSILDVIETDNIECIVYEKPGGRNFTGVRSHSNFEGIILQICEENNLEFKDYSAGEIKRYAKETYCEFSGEIIKGHVNKTQMVEWATLFFEPLSIIDDNHADALWLYELANSQLNR